MITESQRHEIFLDIGNLRTFVISQNYKRRKEQRLNTLGFTHCKDFADIMTLLYKPYILTFYNFKLA